MTRDDTASDRRGGDWVSYWRSPDRPLEAMHAHFRQRVYHRHVHETYSFGVTDAGAQAFTCRGGMHTSAAGMVMTFNPDDPHDGCAAAESGFTYRMIHIGTDLVADVLTDAGTRPRGLPLFANPVAGDPVLAHTVRRLHEILSGPATALARDEQLSVTLTELVRRAAPRSSSSPDHSAARSVDIAHRVRALLDDTYTENISADYLASAVACSRFAVCRAFQAAYGLSPSEYQRQLRLRAARRLLARGDSPANVAAGLGFADQSHLTRWFIRSFGITPGAYRRAASSASGATRPRRRRPPAHGGAADVSSR